MKVTVFVSMLMGIVATVAIGATDVQNEQAVTNNQEVSTMQEVHDFIQNCGVYFIATADGDQPRVRPFGTIAIFEGKLYIQTGRKKNVAQQILANSKLELCAYNQENGRWLRLAATAVPDDRIEARQFMLDKYPALKSMYKAEDDNTLVLFLKDATATFSSFNGESAIVSW